MKKFAKLTIGHQKDTSYETLIYGVWCVAHLKNIHDKWLRSPGLKRRLVTSPPASGFLHLFALTDVAVVVVVIIAIKINTPYFYFFFILLYVIRFCIYFVFYRRYSFFVLILNNDYGTDLNYFLDNTLALLTTLRG